MSTLKSVTNRVLHDRLGRLVALVVAVCLSGWLIKDSRADSVAQVQTAKRIAASTVALIDPESGTSTGGSSTDVNYAIGDILTFTMQFTPVPNGAVRGLGGYLTEYVPGNTQVVGARIIDRDGNTIRPVRGGLTADGFGRRGANDFSAFGLEQGSMSQIYADTGIFFSTDLRTKREPADELITVFNGLEMDPAPTGAGQLNEFLGIPANEPFFAHNLWDWIQANAFGSSGEVGAPVGGDINTRGTGNAPHFYGSAVAGPQTHYLFEATQTAPEIIEPTDTVGPWQRIAYPGSEIGVGNFVTEEGIAVRVGIPTTSGVDLSVDNPLPVGTNAVRFALGELVAGDEYFAEISLRVLASPLDPDMGLDANCAEVFGGDGSAKRVDPIDGGKDNSWRYFLPSPACVLLNLFFELDVDTILAESGDTLTYTVNGKNLSTNPMTDVVVTDAFITGEVTFVSANPAPLSVVNGLITWPTISSLAPGEEFTFTVTVTAGGSTESTLNRSVFTSAQLPGGFSTVALTNIGQRALIDLDLVPTPAVVAPGGTFSYTASITDTGNGTGTADEFIVTLPDGITIVDGTSSINGTPVADPAGGPIFIYTNGLVDAAPGATVSLVFDVAVGGGVAAGLYTGCLETWHRDDGFGRNINDSVCGLGTVAVSVNGRSDTPVMTGQLAAGATCASGTTTEGDGATVDIYVNGILRSTTTSLAGEFTGCGLPALFGGQHVTATVTNTVAGELESAESAPNVVVSTPTCNDGIDNDGDGAIDFPADPGCDSPSDGDETNEPLGECSDGIDNDGDGVADFAGTLPGATDPNLLADNGCSGPNDQTEDNTPECNDSVDNDSDGLTDTADPDCVDVDDATEAGLAACQNFIDDDGDGLIDFAGLDADNSGTVDVNADPGCVSAFDDDETNEPVASEIKARLLIVMDTSGSMNFNTCNSTFTGGDGSTECPGLDVETAVCDSDTSSNGSPDDSRIAKVKSGISDVIAGYGEAEYGLMRFAQRAEDFQCPTAAAAQGSGGWQGGGAAPCEGGFNEGELLVGFASENQNEILAYMDGESNYPGFDPEIVPAGLDHEIRGSGTTPIGGALSSANDFLTNESAIDPVGVCRPYAVVLVTDGGETCDGDPVTRAAELLADGFEVYVIGFATSDQGIIDGLDDIASAGGTGSAIVVDDAATLSQAMADIITATILVERCNGADDDCDCPGDTNGDGAVCGPGDVGVDEDFPTLGETCDNGAAGVCFEEGIQVCTADELGTECNNDPGTTPGAVIEVCNNLDDDCDLLVDEGLSCEGCTPTLEICNNLDDDCDGQVDEDTLADPLPGEGDSCGISEGVCLPGALECTVGAFICVGGVDPGLENDINLHCDGLDNDCDTVIDEISEACFDPNDDGAVVDGCDVGTGVCQGVCEIGLRTCFSEFPFGPGTCQGDVGPSADVCDGLDNDCDGIIDNGFPVGDSCDNGLEGACFDAGTVICNPADNTTTICTAIDLVGSDEFCNDVDDDCDGDVDEELGAPVGEVCGGLGSGCGTTGVVICESGVLSCDAVNDTGSAEICNGVDDDCDCPGDTNLDGVVCGPGDDGVDEETEPLPGVGEQCYPFGDGNGCDLGTGVCEGICQLGATVCELGGNIACVGGIGPQAGETCNGLDDNCDGVIDESAECPVAGDVCLQAECISPCGTGEFPCPVDFVCNAFPGEGDFCVADPCLLVECADTELCNSLDGTCSNPCDATSCPTGSECLLGGCFDCFDAGFECAEDENCAIADNPGIGECVQDLCFSVECEEGRFCRDGNCIDIDCDPACADGERCTDGVCTADLCADLECGARICNPNTGECANDLCTNKFCPQGTTCSPATGDCIGDPCLEIDCPAELVCVVGFDGEGACVEAVIPEDEGSWVQPGGGGGCSTSGSTSSGLGGFFLLGLAAFTLRRRRRAE